MEHVITLKWLKHRVFLLWENMEERKFWARLWFPDDFRGNKNKLIHLNSLNITKKNLETTNYGRIFM